MSSSSKLFPYKIKKGQWYRADDVAESDIAVVVDTKRETIWFWEGTKSSARDRSTGRDMLGQLKKKYIPYRFKRVTNISPPEVLDKLDELRQKSFTGKIPGVRFELKDFSRVFYILNIVSAALVIFGIVFVFQSLLWSVETIGGQLHTVYIFESFLFYINVSSFIVFTSSLIFLVSAFFGGILKKKVFSSLSLIAGLIMFIAFFLIRIWDVNIFYEESGQDILLRKDVLILFVLNIEFLLITAMSIGIINGILGLKNIQIFEAVEELEEKKEKA